LVVSVLVTFLLDLAVFLVIPTSNSKKQRKILPCQS